MRDGKGVCVCSEGIGKTIIWTSPRRCWAGAPVCAGISAPSLSRTIRFCPPGTRARRGGGRTAAIWASACGKSWGSRGERYELCRSVHAEANAIIHASRSEMTGATLYLVGVDAQTGGAGARREPLLHVQEDDHQRGDFPGNHPEHARLFHGHLRAGMGRKRWIPPGGTGLLRLPPENRLRAMDSGPAFFMRPGGYLYFLTFCILFFRRLRLWTILRIIYSTSRPTSRPMPA